MSAILIRVNDEERSYPVGTCVRLIVEEATGRTLGEDGRPTDEGGLGVAVAVDGAVVPRSAWAVTPLADGARVELVNAVQGG